MVTNCITLTAQKTGDHAYFAYQGTHFYQKHKNAEFFGVYKWSPCITQTRPLKKQVTMLTLLTRELNYLKH